MIFSHLPDAWGLTDRDCSWCKGRNTFSNRKGYAGISPSIRSAGKTIYGRSPDEHFVYMVEDALEALGRDKDILVLSSSRLKNGLALMSKASGGLVRIIVVDEDELERLGKPTKTALARTNISISLLTLAHEIGHHVCEHVAGREVPHWQQELEADGVAGAILVTSPWRAFYGARGNKELSLDDILEAGRKVLGSTASETHPPLTARLDAIRAGWKGGPICANVQRKKGPL
jgi:hypothetical protein